jgi:hypothetical protein
MGHARALLVRIDFRNERGKIIAFKIRVNRCNYLFPGQPMQLSISGSTDAIIYLMSLVACSISDGLGMET